MKFGQLGFILYDSFHSYGVSGVFQLESADYVTKRAVIKLEENFEMLPFRQKDEIKVAIDEKFVFSCTSVDLVDANTIVLTITHTLAA